MALLLEEERLKKEARLAKARDNASKSRKKRQVKMKMCHLKPYKV